MPRSQNAIPVSQNADLVQMSTADATIVHVFSGDLWAGAEQMIYALMCALKERGRYRLIAVSMNSGTLSKKLLEAGIETWVLDEASHTFPSLVLGACRVLRGKKVVAIHTHRYKENVLGALVGKLLRTKGLVSTIHGSLERSGARSRGPSGLVESINDSVLRHAFSCLVPVSFELKKQLVEAGRFPDARLSVIHNGILLRNARPKARQDRKELQIGTAGRLIEVKGLDLFMQVALAVSRQQTNVRFRILGEGPLRADLEYQVKSLGLEQVVAFEGYREDAKPFYEDLDLYVNTSIHEGLPLSILEAMSVGTPVVAPRVGGIPEIITDGREGYLIERRDSKAFADKCLVLLQNKQLRERMGVEAQKTILEEYSSQRMAQSYEHIYEQVLCESR